MDELKFRDIPIEIQFNEEASKKHIEEDFAVLTKMGIDSVIRDRFIPWLKGDQFADRDDGQIFEGLKLYEISYNYGRIIAKYSPTRKDDFFGQFEFCFESGSDYTTDILEAVAMQVYVLKGEIVKVGGYDI